MFVRNLKCLIHFRQNKVPKIQVTCPRFSLSSTNVLHVGRLSVVTLEKLSWSCESIPEVLPTTGGEHSNAHEPTNVRVCSRARGGFRLKQLLIGPVGI